MLNKLRNYLGISFLFWAICIGALFYINVKGLPFDVSDTLLIVPKNVNTFSFNIKELEEFNDEKFILTYEITDTKNINTLNKNFSAKIIETNYNYLNIYKLPIISGCFFTKEIQENNRNAIVLNKYSSFNFFGTTNITENEIKIGEKNYFIIGVIDDGEEKNTIYLPNISKEKEPNNLLISLTNTDVEKITSSLKNIGITSDAYYFTVMDFVLSSIFDKFYLVLHFSLIIILIIICIKLFETIIEDIKEINIILINELYFKDLFIKKPFKLMRIFFSSITIFAFIYIIFGYFQKYIVKFLQWDINWNSIKHASIFKFMTEKIMNLHQITDFISFCFCIIVAYTIVLFIIFLNISKIQQDI